MKVLERVKEARLATLDLLYLQHSKPSWPHPVCSARQSEDLTEKKKRSSKLSKRPKYRRKYSLMLLLPQLLLLLPQLLLLLPRLLLLLPRLPHQIFLMKKIVSRIIVSKIMIILLP
jgi:hypothetical protein